MRDVECLHNLEPVRIDTFPTGPMAGRWLALECRCGAGTWEPLDRPGRGTAEMLALVELLATP